MCGGTEGVDSVNDFRSQEMLVHNHFRPPHDLWPIRTDLDISRPSRHRAPRSRRASVALRAPTDPLGHRADMNGPGVLVVDGDRLDHDTVESEQQGTTTVGHARAFALLDALRTPSAQGRQPQSVTDTIRIGHTRPPPSRKSRRSTPSPRCCRPPPWWSDTWITDTVRKAPRRFHGAVEPSP